MCIVISPVFKQTKVENGYLGDIHDLINRYVNMKQVCHRYADKMRPESILHDHVPKSHKNFQYYPVKRFAFCSLPGVASKSIKTFLYTGEMGKPSATSLQSFAEQFPRIMKGTKPAIVVRHPLERLVSIYRCESIVRE